MNFYLAAVDDMLGQYAEEQAIGLILCSRKNETVVEYALRDISKPMGVATYKVLPPQVQEVLPTPEEVRRYLEKQRSDTTGNE